MRVGKVKAFWITVLSVAATLSVSLHLVVLSLGKRLTRDRADFLIRRWSKRLLTIIGLRCQTFGEEQLSKVAGRPVIIMCNHSSLYDIPISFVALPDSLRMLAKKELFSIPVFGQALRCSEFVSIDRNKRSTALHDLNVAKQKMQNGIMLWIAPEGTRSKDGKLGKLERGGFLTAIDTQACIVPVGIRGAHQILPAKTLNYRCNEQVEVHIGAPIDAAEYGLANKDALITEVANQLRQLADID